MPTDRETIESEAQRWIDSLERKWRLQILSKRYRVDPSTGQRKELPLRIRRFAEGIPYSCVDAALRYLLSKAPYTDVIYNGMLVEGEYVPTLTTWVRDDRETVNGISKTDGTYTLIQDLVDRLYVDRYLVGSSRSCTEEVSTEWTWDTGAIEAIPDVPEGPQGWQGITYAIQSVSRNEDGTFNYALVKRVAKTQHMPRVAVKETPEGTVEIETWDNLYGEPPEFRDEGWNVLDPQVPAAAKRDADGRHVELQISKNDDCTYKAQATYVTASAETDPEYVSDASCVEETTYAHRWHVPDVENVSDRTQGETKAVQNLRREDDGTYSYVVVTRRAVTRDTGYVTQTDSSDGVTKVRTVANAYGEPGGWLSYAGGEFGPFDPEIPAPGVYQAGQVDVKAERNQDCTYQVVVTVTKLKKVCPERQTSKTIYESDVSEKCAGQEEKLGDAPDAEGGNIVTHESQLQPDGTYTNREAVKTELPVSASTKTVESNRRGVRTTTVDSNQEKPASTESIPVGTAVKVEKTPGGLYNNTVTEWDRTASVKAGDLCTEDVFHHQHDVTVAGGEVEMPPDDDHVEGSGEGGLVVTRRTDMDDDGGVSQTTSRNQEILAPESEETWQVGLHGVIHTVEHRHVDLGDPVQSGLYGGDGALETIMSLAPDSVVPWIGGRVSRKLTPGGFHDITLSNVQRISGFREERGCSKTVLLHTDSEALSAGEVELGHMFDAGPRYVGADGTPLIGATSPVYGGPTLPRGVYVSRTSKMNADGTVVNTATVNVELPFERATLRFESNVFVTSTAVVDKNMYVPALTPVREG